MEEQEPSASTDPHPQLSHEECERTLHVTGLPEDSEDDDIYPVFESERLGGGMVEQIRRPTATFALITFQDVQVVERLLTNSAKKPLKMQGHTLSLERCGGSKPGPSNSFVRGRCVVVSQVTPDVDLEELVRLLENKRKGGGSVEKAERLDLTGDPVLVTFVEQSIAEHWVNTGQLKFGARNLPLSWPTKDQMDSSSSDQDQTDPCVIYVSDVTEELMEHVLLHLENTRAGGGIYEESRLSEDGTLMAKFADVQVAQHFTEQGFIEVNKKRLVVSQRKSKDTSRSPDDVPVSPTTVEVSGIPASTSEDYVRMYFESQKRSGGGELACLQYNKNDGTATVTFLDHRAVARVQKRKHKMEDNELTIRVLESLTADLRDQECAVRVSNIPPSISDDYIKLHFESEKRSGGGTIEEFFALSTDVAIITFKSPQVADRVSKRPHQLDKVDLSVERLVACPPPPMISTDVDEQKLLFTGLPVTQKTRNKAAESALDDDDVEKLKNFVKRAAGKQILHVTYSTERDKAVITFQTTPDYKSMRKLVVSKPFQGRMISVEKVPYTSSIIVRGVAQINQEMISMHFENRRRSGGGDVTSATKHNDFAVVEFKYRNVIPRVLAQKQVIDNREVQVDLFCLYLSQSSSSSSRPQSVIIPQDVAILLDKSKTKFVRSSAKFRAKLESDLASSRCEVQWPADDDAGKVVLRCTLGNEDADAAELVENWKEKCQSVADQHISGIDSVEERVSGEIWEKFLQEIKSTAVSEISESYTEQDKSSFTMLCVGSKDNVTRFHAATVAITTRLMEELAKAKSKKFETIKGLTAAQLQIVKTSRFWEAMSSDVEVTFDGHGMSLQGTEAEILAVKVEMYEKIINQIRSRNCPCDQFKLKLLSKPEVMQYFQNVFKQKKLNVACTVVAKHLVLHGLDDSSVSIASDTFDRELTQQKVQLDSASSGGCSLPQWKEVEMSLMRNSKVLEIAVAPDKMSVSCCGLRDEVKAATEELKKFFEQNTIVEQFVQLPEGKVKYIQKHLMAEVDSIVQKASQNGTVKMEPIEDGERSGFVVRGTRPAMRQASVQVFELSKVILEFVHDSELLGTQKYFATKRGRDSLTAIENRTKVVVVMSEEELNEDDDDADPFLAASGGKPAVPVIKSEVCVTGTKTMIRVVKGSVMYCRADALIITISDDLKHTDGAARLVALAGGKEIEDECQAIIKSGSKPLAGDSFVTKPGKLDMSSVVIHAVVKPWQGGHHKEDDLLYTAVTKALESAEARNMSTVALAGVDWDFPASVACQNVLDAVAEYQTKPYHFREILLVDGRDQHVNHFHENLERHFGKQNVKMVSEQSGELPIATANTANTSAGATQPVTSRYAKTTDPAILKTPEGITVTLVKGQIADQQVDVIVNTVAQDFDLSRGAVAKSLLARAAGLQQECRKQVAQGSQSPFGHVVRTNAGGAGSQLRCTEVFHGVCSRWDGKTGSCQQIMRELIKKCLEMAHGSSRKSIAIPAIGTGNLGVPADVACWIMYDSVDKFSQSNPATSLKDIHFVVYDKDPKTIAAFDHFVQTLAGPAVQSKAAAVRQRIVKRTVSQEEAASSSASAVEAGTSRTPEHADNVVAKGRKKSKKAGKGDKKKAAAAEPVNLRKKWIKIGNLKMEVVEGDITEEKTDVIVNSTNDALILTGGAVSKAILKKGGKTIEEQCKRHGKTRDGIAVTTAGNLPSKCIIHMATPQAYDRKGPASKEWEERIIRCLQEAERMKMNSIAFPLLGTGKWTTPAKEMAEIILNAVGEFSIDEKPKHLHLVRITIFQSNMVDDFAQAVAKKIEDRNSRGFLDRVKDWWSGAGDMKLVDCEDSDEDDEEADEGQAPASRQYKIAFHLYGPTQTDIDNVIKEIDELGKEAVSDTVLDKPEHQARIAKLTTQQISYLHKVAIQHRIKLTVDQGKRLNRIRLQGDAADIPAVLDAVHKCFHQCEESEHKKTEADLIAQQAHWEYQLSDESFESYPKEINAIIEKAFVAKKPSAEWQEESNEAFQVDFSQNVEISKATGEQTPVKRICDVPIPQPKNWNAMAPSEQFLTVIIPMGDKEFEAVEQNIKLSAKSSIKEIIKIERIQNPKLYQQYAVCKMHMDAANGPNIQNERVLWHGTKPDKVQNINNDGFNRSYCGENAVAFGNGVYFARDWTYSANETYSPPDGQGHKRIYQSRVLTGQFTQGQHGYKDTPLKPNSQVLRYDSVVNNEANPSIFVVFRDSQAYPEYLITFI